MVAMQILAGLQYQFLQKAKTGYIPNIHWTPKVQVSLWRTCVSQPMQWLKLCEAIGIKEACRCNWKL